MRLNFRKSVIFIAVVGALGAGAASPAAADGWGWGHGGYGGYGRYGYGYGGGWRRGGWDNGGAAAAAALGGFALGAMAGVATQPRYAAPYGQCYFVERPVMDGWGNVIDYRRAQVCD